MKKRWVLGCTAFMVSAMLCGCGSSKSDSYYDNGYSTSASYVAAEAPADYDYGYDAAESWEEESSSAEWDTDTTTQDTSRKLIRNVNMNVETKEYDAFLVKLENQISLVGGYISNMDSYNGSTYSYYRSERYSNLTIRIPANKLDGFLSEVSAISNVISRNESVDDITLTYVDVASHKAALETEQERLLELLEQAENLEEVLQIEDRLTSVRYQLQSMESQLRTYDDQVSYSTVYMYISEVEELTVVEEKSAGERIVEGFTQNLLDVIEGLKEFGINFIIDIPYIILWLLIMGGIFCAIFFPIRASEKKRKKKLAARKAAEAAQAEAAQAATPVAEPAKEVAESKTNE